MSEPVCSYCGSPADQCGCGGFAPTETPEGSGEELWQQPFLHNGYVVWAMTKDLWRYDTLTYHFFLGDTLVETIIITRDLIREFVPEDQSFMPFLWKLLEIAQGKEEVMRVEVMNRRRPAKFEIRRVPTDREKELDRLNSLPEGEMMQEIYRTQGR